MSYTHEVLLFVLRPFSALNCRRRALDSGTMFIYIHWIHSDVDSYVSFFILLVFVYSLCSLINSFSWIFFLIERIWFSYIFSSRSLYANPSRKPTHSIQFHVMYFKLCINHEILTKHWNIQIFRFIFIELIWTNFIEFISCYSY